MYKTRHIVTNCLLQIYKQYFLRERFFKQYVFISFAMQLNQHQIPKNTQTPTSVTSECTGEWLQNQSLCAHKDDELWNSCIELKRKKSIKCLVDISDIKKIREGRDNCAIQ